jgi:hypothetical protein
MQSYFRNALLAITALVAVASTAQKAHAQNLGAVTVTLTEPTEIAGRVLDPGEYVIRKTFGQWYLTLEDAHTHRTIGFLRYQTTSDHESGEARVTTATLDDNAPAKIAIRSLYIPETGREFTFAVPERRMSQPRSSYAGK